MKEFYEKSILELGKFKKLPHLKEWNKIAKEKNLMGSKALMAYSGISFAALYKREHKRLREESYMKLIR